VQSVKEKMTLDKRAKQQRDEREMEAVERQRKAKGIIANC
jgi:hypothetical protein